MADTAGRYQPLETPMILNPYRHEAAGGGGSGITLEDHIIESDGSTGTTTTGINSTGSNLMLVYVASYTLGSHPTITDSESNTWTEAVSTSNSYYKGILYYCAGGTTSSSHTVTTSGGTTYASVFVGAFSGAASSPLDQTSSDPNYTPGSITPTDDGSLVLAGITDFENTTNRSIDEGMTTDSTFQINAISGTRIGAGVAYKIQETAAAIDPTFGSINTYATLIASFLPA